MHHTIAKAQANLPPHFALSSENHRNLNFNSVHKRTVNSRLNISSLVAPVAENPTRRKNRANNDIRTAITTKNTCTWIRPIFYCMGSFLYRKKLLWFLIQRLLLAQNHHNYNFMTTDYSHVFIETLQLNINHSAPFPNTRSNIESTSHKLWYGGWDIVIKPRLISKPYSACVSAFFCLCFLFSEPGKDQGSWRGCPFQVLAISKKGRIMSYTTQLTLSLSPISFWNCCNWNYSHH